MKLTELQNHLGAKILYTSPDHHRKHQSKNLVNRNFGRIKKTACKCEIFV